MSVLANMLLGTGDLILKSTMCVPSNFKQEALVSLNFFSANNFTFDAWEPQAGFTCYRNTG